MKILSSLLFALLLTVNAASATTETDVDFVYESGETVFSDVSESHWAFDYLNSADNVGFFELGAIDDSSGVFRCDEFANRAEASKLIAIMFGSVDTEEFVDSTNADFDDVNSGDWFYTYIEYLSSKGILHGYTDNTFRPDAYIMRAEMAKVAAGFLFHLEDISENVSLDIPSGTQTFTDVSESDWFYPYIELLAKGDDDYDFYDPLSGYSDDSFHPNAYVTRCEMVKMTAEAYELYQFVSALANLDWEDLLQ